MNYKNDLIQLVIRDAFQVGDFTLASGKKSAYYIDARKVTLQSHGAWNVAHCIMEILLEFPENLLFNPPNDGDPAFHAALAVSRQAAA